MRQGLNRPLAGILVAATAEVHAARLIHRDRYLKTLATLRKEPS